MLSALIQWSVCLTIVASKAMTGTNAGGWMVLEPWITPSLFYRFLDKTQNDTAMDSFTLCTALGPVEGNAVMRAHWDAWYNESSISDLAKRGVEIIRLPVGDWTLNPYGPYVGCMDGAAEKIDWFYNTCAKYNIKVLMDVHAMKDSQNGYDNSGKTSNVVWSDASHFLHWANQASNWYGDWNVATQKYEHYNFASVNWGLQVHESLLQRWGSHSAFYAFEPINEPQYQPVIEVLQDFYRQSRKLVQRYTANAWFVMHNAQVLDPEVWNSLFRDDDMDHVAIDIHWYQAFLTGARFQTPQDACDEYETVISQQVDRLKYPVWLGEWALATDVCAWWLGGFNTANTHPQYTCEQVACPTPYMAMTDAGKGVDIPDRTKTDAYGPFGDPTMANSSLIVQGTCTSDSLYFKGDNVTKIARCALDTFDRHVNATFLWTAHNEIEEKWDYVKAWDLGWINKTAVPVEQQLVHEDLIE